MNVGLLTRTAAAILVLSVTTQATSAQDGSTLPDEERSEATVAVESTLAIVQPFAQLAATVERQLW